MKDIENYLEMIDVPEGVSKTYQQVLRKKLITSFDDPPSHTSAFPAARDLVGKKGGEYMKYRMFQISMGISLVILLFVGLSLTNGNPFLKTPHAEAQELVKRVIQTVDDLTPVQRAEIEKQIKGDLTSSLEEAKNAKDLKIISKEEFHKIMTAQSKEMEGFFKQRMQTKTEDVIKDGPKVMKFEKRIGDGEFTAGKMLPHPNVGKILQYTDKNGRETFLGLDEKEVPVMKVIKIKKEDMGGMIGVPAMESKHIEIIEGEKGTTEESQ